MIENLTILAPGLLGASIAMAARERSVAKTIRIWARRQESVDSLNGKDWCDFASTNLVQSCKQANLIIICAPVERIIELSQRIAPSLENCPIITDVGSTKFDIVSQCTELFQGKAKFIGSHPMAGSEKTGMENAQADLFQDRTCFVTPTPDTSKSVSQTVTKFWEALGSTILTETPQTHDELTAKASHSPHVIAAALASYLGRECADANKFCGNGLRDTTRIASGDPNLWAEIISQNKTEILKTLGSFQEELDKYSAAISNGDHEAIIKLLAHGKKFRDSLN